MKQAFWGIIFLLLSSVLFAQKEVTVIELEKSKKTDHYFVLMTFGGQTFRMILDTGAGMSVLNQSKVASLEGVSFKDLSPEYQYEGNKKVQMALISDVMLGGKSLAGGAQLLSMDLAAVLSIYEGVVAGVCGMSLFEGRIVLFDWAKKKLFLYEEMPPLPRGACEWKVKYQNLGYYLEGFSYADKEGKVQANPFLALIDTGATATTLPRFTWPGEVKKVGMGGITTAESTQKSVLAPQMMMDKGVALFPCVGRENPMKLKAFSPFFTEGALAGSYSLGLVGMDIFKKGRLLIDGREHRVWWLPAQAPLSKGKRKQEK